MFTKVTAVILAVLTVLLANSPLASIFKRKEIKHRYIIIQDAVFYVPKSPDSPFSQAVREIINK